MRGLSMASHQFVRDQLPFLDVLPELGKSSGWPSAQAIGKALSALSVLKETSFA